VVQSELAERGFAAVPEEGREGALATTDVLVTAHGISDRERRALHDRGHRLVDTTCPLVRHAHGEARRLAAEGRHVIVLGRRGHVEVRGLCGDLDSFTVVGTPGDVAPWPYAALGVVCQTTMPPAEAALLLDAIERANPQANVAFADTICEPTKRRQQALRDLLGRVDAVVVIGGARSHNTRQLAEACRAAGARVLQVRDAGELEPSFFAGCETVGLTAGTSTPDATIEAVAAALASMPATSEGTR
jgi:4-hydroxy-3-methylbut-2-enyl diphosphate reductase